MWRLKLNEKKKIKNRGFILDQQKKHYCFLFQKYFTILKFSSKYFVIFNAKFLINVIFHIFFSIFLILFFAPYFFRNVNWSYSFLYEQFLSKILGQKYFFKISNFLKIFNYLFHFRMVSFNNFFGGIRISSREQHFFDK